MIHVADKRPVQAPSTQWWVIAGALAPLFERITVTFATLQSLNLVISQQRQEVSNLMAEIATGLDIRFTMDATLINEINPTTIIQLDGWIVTKDVVVMHIRGSWARDLYNEFSDIEKQQTLQENNIFSLSIVVDGLQIQAERDSNNNARELEAPPVMPADLIKMRPGVFISEVVDQYREHLAKQWSVDLIDKAESEHRELITVYAREPDVKVAIDKHNKKTFFNEAWDCLKGRFMQLRQLCGGLVTAFSNRTSVESDFSIIKWEKNDFRSSLTSLSLVGIMHAKQFEQIKMIKRQSFA
ncbi:unnamed protein product [Sphagnum jensenii]|uniref:Transposase n=1 Tax=Sphagnum jensenii TaxID=128206 RepID=A0ABP1BL28_9BRYO